MGNTKIRNEMMNDTLMNPAGNILEELNAADLNQIAGATGGNVAKTSNGTLCSVTIECSVVLWTAICCV